MIRASPAEVAGADKTCRVGSVGKTSPARRISPRDSPSGEWVIRSGSVMVWDIVNPCSLAGLVAAYGC